MAKIFLKKKNKVDRLYTLKSDSNQHSILTKTKDLVLWEWWQRLSFVLPEIFIGLDPPQPPTQSYGKGRKRYRHRRSQSRPVSHSRDEGGKEKHSRRLESSPGSQLQERIPDLAKFSSHLQVHTYDSTWGHRSVGRRWEHFQCSPALRWGN